MPAEDFSPPGPNSTREYFRPDDHVVGYVVASSPADAAPLLHAISEYASRWGLGSVEEVYRDLSADGERPGLDSVMGDLRGRKAHAVIVPTPQHISTDHTAWTSWLAHVRTAGGVVHLIEPVPPAEQTTRPTRTGHRS